MVTSEGSTPPETDAAVPPRPARPKRSPYRSVMRLRNYRRLWIGMTVSSLGDWIGLFALLSITNRLAPGNTLAVAGLMVFRMLPAFLVGPLAGVALDRMDRRKAMIVCNLAQACLIATIPFAKTLPMLYAISFALETISLFWMPAKDSLVPSLVPDRWLVAANSLALFTTYGVFPLGAAIFAGLVGAAEFLTTHFETLDRLGLGQENLALWIDTATFLVSAVMVARITFPGLPREKRSIRLKVIWEEVVEGLRYLKQRGEVARVMRGLGVAIAGGAVVFSLGAPYTTLVLDGGAKGFGGIVAFLGTGLGLGVLVLGFVGDRLQKGWVFAAGILAGGLMLIGASMVTSMAAAFAISLGLGACSGIAYASGFALMQERVADAVRGRTFASVQIVIRVSLFASLVAFPALAELFTTLPFVDDTGEGIRLSIAFGGLVACAAGTVTALDVYRGRIEA